MGRTLYTGSNGINLLVFLVFFLMDVLPVAEAWMEDSYLVRAYEGLVVF